MSAVYFSNTFFTIVHEREQQGMFQQARKKKKHFWGMGYDVDDESMTLSSLSVSSALRMRWDDEEKKILRVILKPFSSSFLPPALGVRIVVHLDFIWIFAIATEHGAKKKEELKKKRVCLKSLNAMVIDFLFLLPFSFVIVVIISLPSPRTTLSGRVVQ